ncbi:MAG: hypothetical protein WCG49_05235 [Actinomycetes bacterium]
MKKSPQHLRVWRRSAFVAISCAIFVASTSSCGEPKRTGTQFCRQLAKELPQINTPIATQNDIDLLVASYERIGKVAPIDVAKDWEALTALLAEAAHINTGNTTDVEAITKHAYESNTAAQRAFKWTLDTCAVDISGSRPASQ